MPLPGLFRVPGMIPNSYLRMTTRPGGPGSMDGDSSDPL
jgi:hypothetical protein